MKFKKYIRKSIEDMNKRCEKCNTLLNDSCTCPKCDDGEEDYRDELKESMTNLEKLKKAFPELNFDSNINEELSNTEKLKRAYPELDFTNSVTEEVVKEELSNWEKLTKVYPELLVETESLTEGTGAEAAHTVKDAMNVLAKEDKNKWASTVAEVVNVIPDSFADELFDKIKDTFKDFKLTAKQSKQITDAANTEEIATSEADTLGNVLDILDTRDQIEDNADFIKTLVIVILGIIAVIEPTPVVEIITAIVSMLPANIIAKIVSITQLTNPVVAGAAIVNKIIDSKNESLRSINVKEKTFNEKEIDDTTDDVSDDDDWSDYDDDYSIDDVEEDHLHAALYGGDRTYCNCGKKLVYDEDGYAYCPDCDNQHDDSF